jgi:hypothetical protein
MTQSPFKTVCYAIAVAMGVAVIVTNFLIPQSITTITNLLAIGLALIGIANLQ